MTSKEALEELLCYANLHFKNANIYKTEFSNKVEQSYISDNEENFKIIEKDLDRLENLEKYLKIIIKKRLNFDRFDYAIKYWKTTKEQVDVYNSGIGNCYRLTEEEYELLKEVLENE